MENRSKLKVRDRWPELLLIGALLGIVVRYYFNWTIALLVFGAYGLVLVVWTRRRKQRDIVK
jgi:ABC-type Mn2+/Zn2+ transport system permease subunit